MDRELRLEKTAYLLGRVYVLSNGGGTVELTSAYAIPRLVPQFKIGDEVRLDEYHVNSPDPNFREGIWVSETAGADDPIFGRIISWEAVMVERAESRSWFGVGYVIEVPVIEEQVRNANPGLDISYYKLPTKVEVLVKERFLLERNTRIFDWKAFAEKQISNIFVAPISMQVEE